MSQLPHSVIIELYFTYAYASLFISSKVLLVQL